MCGVYFPYNKHEKRAEMKIKCYVCNTLDKKKEEYVLRITNTKSIRTRNTTLIILHKITRIKIHRVKQEQMFSYFTNVL